MRLMVTLLCLFEFVGMEIEQDSPNVELGPKENNVTTEYCICVPYWQCKEDFSGLVDDGINIIDIRITKSTNVEPCKGDFDVCCQVECGRRNTNLLSSLSGNDSWKDRILGGNNEADFGEFPWMLAIIRNKVFLCGGSLIHPQVAITAAHCVLEDEMYVIRAGEWNWATKNEPLPFQERTTKKIIVHTKYRPESLENDIAIIILSTPFQLTESVGVTCLPTPSSKTDNKCLATGWGKTTAFGTYQSILKKITLPIVPRERCSKALSTAVLGPHFKLHKSFVCAGGDSKDTCKGDGGSPLICPIRDNPSRYEQIGIVSWGLTCGLYQAPGVYVNVALYTGWIDEEVEKNNFSSRMYKRN